MADHWRVAGLVPGSPQTIRDAWQILGGCQGWFLAVSGHQGHMADRWKVSGLVPGSPQTIRDTWSNVKILLKVLCNGFVSLWPTPIAPNS